MTILWLMCWFEKTPAAEESGVRKLVGTASIVRF